MEKLATAEKKFSERLPPVEALRVWMLLFVDYVATKADYRPRSKFARRRPSKLYEGSRGQIRRRLILW